MLNHSIKRESQGIFIAAILIGLLTLVLTIFRGNGILDDPFHHGEYFAATVSLFPEINSSFHSLTIHGALDFIPALIAEHQWGSNNYFLPTFAIYKTLDFLAAIVLILNAYELTKSKPLQWLLLLSVAALAPLLVGYRDLFLLISLFLFLRISDRDQKYGLSIILQILFCFVVAFGIFWSYDRGIAGSISLGAAVLVLSLRNRWYAISLISFVATVASLSLIFKVFSIQNYLDDILTLMETSGQWSYGWKRMPIVLTVFTIIVNIIAISLLVGESIKSKSFFNELPLSLCLGFLSIFMLKIGVNRADTQHIYWTLWIPMLASFHLYEKNLPIKMKSGILISVIFVAAIALTIMNRAYAFAMVAGILAFTTLDIKNKNIYRFCSMCFGLLVAGCLGLVFYTGLKGFANAQYTWMRAIPSPPINRLSTTEGVVWAADRLQERFVNCVFDLSNNGVINGLTRRPSCSRFTYPVYAGSKHELNLINDLRNAMPPAIVYSSTYWSYKIDGRDMKDRFPQLDEFILKNYPKEECSLGYCVRYM